MYNEFRDFGKCQNACKNYNANLQRLPVLARSREKQPLAESPSSQFAQPNLSKI